jgi:hypothetical protein
MGRTESSSFVGAYVPLLPLLASVFFVHASHRSPSLLSGTKVFTLYASSSPLEVSSSHFCFSSQVLVLTVHNTVLVFLSSPAAVRVVGETFVVSNPLSVSAFLVLKTTSFFALAFFSCKA